MEISVTNVAEQERQSPNTCEKGLDGGGSKNANISDNILWSVASGWGAEK